MNTEALIHQNRRTVLVVEDEAINRELLGFILESSYRVLYAENGQEALDIIRQNLGKISMVLLDLNMPVMNGFELLKIMGADEQLKSMPVIVLTAERSSELESLRLGALDFIMKPYDMPQIILARVKRIIQFVEDRQIISDVENDDLTGLYNRQFFHEYAYRLLSSAQETAMDMVVVDVDRFHLINEMHGKAVGDQVLRLTADGIRDALKDSLGIGCRCEADLFFLFIRHSDDHETLYRRITGRLNGLTGLGNLRLRMGVYENVGGDMPMEWYSDAAKSACDALRGNFAVSVGVYDDEMHKKELYNERLLGEMEKALEQKQFKVYFQPKYDVTSDTPRLISAEALVRWIHPELGFISPGAFIPLFEENGLISRLDAYIWRQTAEHIRDWRDRLGILLPVSVNLSRMDLFDPQLLEKLLEIVRDNDLQPRDLRLEVTESAYAQDTGHIIKTVAELREAGFEIEMDDFGSGYSSLNMLCLMPIDAMKIDMRFVKNITGGMTGFRMLELVVDIAHNLSVPAIVEGVEDEDQYQMVRKAGCDIVQGYYFSRPVDGQTFEGLLKKG